jgi:hypothetical protein
LTRLAALHAATPQLAPGALARKPQLSIRVEALLAGGRDRRRRYSRGALAAAGATLAMAAIAAAPLAPVTVALPPRPSVAVRSKPAPGPVAEAQAAPARQVRVRPARRLVAGLKSPAGSSPPPVRRVEPAVMLYVVYVDGGDAGWIRILWVHEIPAPVSNHT